MSAIGSDGFPTFSLTRVRRRLASIDAATSKFSTPTSRCRAAWLSTITFLMSSSRSFSCCTFSFICQPRESNAYSEEPVFRTGVSACSTRLANWPSSHRFGFVIGFTPKPMCAPRPWLFDDQDAQEGIGPSYSGFADRRLTTWLQCEMSDVADSPALHSAMKVLHHNASLRQRYGTAPHRTI